MNAKAWEGRGSVLFRQLEKLGDKAIKVSFLSFLVHDEQSESSLTLSSSVLPFSDLRSEQHQDLRRPRFRLDEDRETSLEEGTVRSSCEGGNLARERGDERDATVS